MSDRHKKLEEDIKRIVFFFKEAVVPKKYYSLEKIKIEYT